MSTTQRPVVNMNTVPNEILQTVLENLDIEQLFQIMKVSYRWREVGYSALAAKFQDTTVTLWIDQEGHRCYQPTFKFKSYNSITRLVRFVPLKPNGAEVYNQSFGLQKPILRLITVGLNEQMDYLEKEGAVSVKHTGRKTLLGSDFSNTDKQTHTWSFSYNIDYFYRDNRKVGGERLFTPESFECSLSFLNPARAHKASIPNPTPTLMTDTAARSRYRKLAKLLWYLKKQTPFLKGGKNNQRKKINGELTPADISELMQSSYLTGNSLAVH